MRAIWKGSISFGLVSIPISLFPATRREELKFRLLRSSDLSPVNYKRVAEADGKRRKLRFDPAKERGVNGLQFTRQRVEGPNVADDVMDVEQHHPSFAVVVRQTDQNDAQKRPGLQIEEVIVVGDREAFSELIRKYEDRIFRLAHKVCAPEDTVL